MAKKTPDEIRVEVEGIVGELAGLAQQQVQRRADIEARWIEDMRQFHGVYDPGVVSELDQSNRSKVFVNITRPKVMTWTARIYDLLFPVDKEPWDIQPTPRPEGDEGPIPNEDAREAADRMREIIRDQFVESSFSTRVREVIFDGVLLGTGILKGPVTGVSVRTRWHRSESGFVLVEEPDDERQSPSWLRVDPWNFFPDMSARTVDEAEFFFERHIMTPSQLRRYARAGVFDAGAVAQILKDGTQEPVPSDITMLREITNADTEILKDRHIIWEYRGRMTLERLSCLCMATPDEDMRAVLETVGALDDIQVVVWFSGTKLLRFALHPLESGRPIYSVFNFAPDPSSVFGLGLPRIIRDSQATLNAAWRAMMDNAAITTGGQIVIAEDRVEPADGSYELRPFKIWHTKNSLASSAPPFQVFEMASHQIELANIIELSRRFADEESQLPLIVQGEQGAHVTKTGFGMSLLMNAANVVFRGIIRHLDDAVIAPAVTRAYEWNMQFHDDENAKGDFRVRAIGSSTLLLRELQSQNYMAIAVNFGAHPLFGPMLDHRKLFEQLLAANSINPETVMLDEQTWAEQAQKPPPEAEQGPSPSDQIKLEIARLKAQVELEKARLKFESDMARYEQQKQIKAEELNATVAAKLEELRRKEEQMAAELAIKERHGSGI